MELPSLIQTLADNWLVICECGADMESDLGSADEVSWVCHECGAEVSMVRKEH
jgi:hypothetical protein